MADDTGIGGPERFQTTRSSVVQAMHSDDPAERARAFATLALGYWKPVYKHLRVKWRKPSEDAKDLAQAFFATALEKSFFSAYDPEVARFRTYVRLCLDRFVAKQVRDATRL